MNGRLCRLCGRLCCLCCLCGRRQWLARQRRPPSVCLGPVCFCRAARRARWGARSRAGQPCVCCAQFVSVRPLLSCGRAPLFSPHTSCTHAHLPNAPNALSALNAQLARISQPDLHLKNAPQAGAFRPAQRPPTAQLNAAKHARLSLSLRYILIIIACPPSAWASVWRPLRVSGPPRRPGRPPARTWASL